MKQYEKKGTCRIYGRDYRYLVVWGTSFGGVRVFEKGVKGSVDIFMLDSECELPAIQRGEFGCVENQIRARIHRIVFNSQAPEGFNAVIGAQ